MIGERRVRVREKKGERVREREKDEKGVEKTQRTGSNINRDTECPEQMMNRERKRYKIE